MSYIAMKQTRAANSMTLWERLGRIMTASFIIVLIFMAVRDWQYAVPAACAVWLLLELAISCGKYRVMPDQLVVLLFATGFGFIPYHST